MYSHWRIPRRMLRDTLAAFRKGDYEVFVLWTAGLAELSNDVCGPVRVVVPKQEHGRAGVGVYVRVEGSELARIQYDNYEHQERSVVQLHTHPSSDVRMSLLDRKWEVVAHVGALSVIVPNYGKDGLEGFPGVAVYERETNGWRLWTPLEILHRFTVVL